MKLVKKHAEAGFTIIEMMLATLVFSVILVVMTMGVLHVTHEYYKGLTLNSTQNAARGIIDSVSQAIQFSGGQVNWPQKTHPSDPPVMSGRACVGSQVYDFQLGEQLDGSNADDSASKVLINSNKSPCASAGGTFTPAGGTELLGKNMRLSALSVKSTGASDSHLYNVAVTVAYGDYDLFCSPYFASHHSGSGGCQPGDALVATSSGGFSKFITSSDLRCKLQTGSQFCAVSALKTTVQQRLVPSS